MPELPEVETICRQLEPVLLGRTVASANSHPSKKFIAARALVGRTFGPIQRRGKFMIFSLDNNHELVAHLGMTGTFRTGEAMDDAPHLRASWGLDNNQHLNFIDIRRFGRLAYVESGDYQTLPTLAKAGPEPFDPSFDGQRFRALLQQSSRPLKTQLLSQRPIAGVGNIYADEALWLARVNPKVRKLSTPRAEAVLAAVRKVLAQGIANGGTTLRDYRGVDGQTGSNQHKLAVYGRGGQPCPRCSTALKSELIGGRTTTWCPDCQT